LRFSVSVQSTDAWTLGCSSYRPRRSPDKEAFCRVFFGFRYSFSRQIGLLSGVLVTVLGGRPTKNILSGVLRFSVSVQPKGAWTLGCSSYRPGRSPDKEAFSRVFCGFRYSFCRQMHELSGVLVTVLGGRPTKKRSVGCFAVFGIRSVDRCMSSRGFWLPS
jgi:hypothetical protein